MSPKRVNGGPVGRWFSRQTDVAGASKVALFTLFGLNLVDEFDRLAFSTLTPEIRDSFNMSDQQIVAVGSISVMFVLLSTVPLGYLTDRYPRVRMARIAAVVWAAMMLVTGVAWAIPVLFAARFFVVAARSSNEVVHTSLLADYYEPKVLPRVFKVHRFANSLGTGASLVAGVIGAALGWRWAFVLLAIPTFALLAGLRGLHEPVRGATSDLQRSLGAVEQPKPPSFRAASRMFWQSRTARRLLLGFGVMGTGLLALAQMMSLFFNRVYGFGPLGRGLVQFLFGVGSALGLLWGGEMGTRYTRKADFAGLCKLVSLGFAIVTAGVVLLALAPYAAVSVLMGPVASFGFGSMAPAFYSLLVRILPPHIRSQGQSFTTMALAVGGLVAIPAAGLGESFGYRPAFLVVACLFLLSVPIVYSAHRTVPDDITRVDELMRQLHTGANPPAATT